MQAHLAPVAQGPSHPGIAIELLVVIEADHDRASRAGAEATPSFMIGNKILAGAQPLDELRKAIDSALVSSKTTKR